MTPTESVASMELSFNAWAGSGSVKSVRGDVKSAARWALQRDIQCTPRFLAPQVADLRDWRSKEVGWGVVLADGATIPQPLQDLISHRQAPVFRYRPDTPHSFTHLRNYESKKDVAIAGSPRGTGPECLPQYLLIYGGPAEVPWQLQYVLNANRCVGRLHITGDALGRYINRLISGWPQANASSNRALVWSVVDHDDSGDITHLMRDAIAEPVLNRLRSDDQIGSKARFLDGQEASGASSGDFIAALAEHRPGFIVSTSHGKTGPLLDKDAMGRDLGLPVDGDGKTLDLADLLAKWQPSGAIWYAHACCSAGADGAGFFAGLFSKESVASEVLNGVAALGPMVAPLATALLSAPEPVRAFIGHVEPTFNWTLEERFTGQVLTAGIIEALYSRLFVDTGETEAPVAYAFRDWYSQTNGLRAQYIEAQTRFNRGGNTEDVLLTTQLAARDIESTVLLGDPTVAMPALV